MSNKTFHGSIVALVTPFKNGKVDEQALGDLVEWHIESGTQGIVPMGTTGESPTVSNEEHMKVVEHVIKTASGRVPIMAGAGSNSTDKAVKLFQHAKSAGADAALVVSPYYNKPSPEGLFQHFKTVAESADLPLFLYNIPGRSIVDISISTMKRLVDACPNIVGVKDATGDLVRPLETLNTLGENFCQLTGEDPTAIPFMVQGWPGARGCISVSANVAPALCAKMHEHYQNGAWEKVAELNRKLLPLHGLMFMEPSPGPAKYALSRMGKCSEEVRLPITPISDGLKKKVDDALNKLGLI